MKKLTKLIKLLMVVLILGTVVMPFQACTPRNEILRIYNWGEYMDHDVLRSFEAWYLEKTGERVEVRETTFGSNEEMFRQIANSNADFDIAVPSDYMVSKMHKAGLLLPFDLNVVTNLGDIDEYLMDVIEAVTPNDGGRVYAMPYMWGTVGIMFDASVIRYEYMNHWGWEALFREIPTVTAPTADEPVVALTEYAIENNISVASRIYMKDGFRDSLVAAQLFNNRETLLQLSDGGTNWDSTDFQEYLENIFDTRPTTAQIAQYREIFINQRNLSSFFKHEIDEGKMEMMDGADNPNRGFMGVFWSCDAGYVVTENPNLAYHVPREGGSIYIDAMVIPKYARNTKAANHFLYYINRFDPENAADSAAFRNMSYVGAPAAVAAAIDAFEIGLEDGTADIYGYTLDELFSDEETGELLLVGETNRTVKDMYINTIMFPGRDIRNRVEYMRDWGGETEHELALMWADVLAHVEGCGNASVALGLALLLPAALLVVRRRR